jgi:hypothetical protein
MVDFDLIIFIEMVGGFVIISDDFTKKVEESFFVFTGLNQHLI